MVFQVLNKGFESDESKLCAVCQHQCSSFGWVPGKCSTTLQIGFMVVHLVLLVLQVHQ